MVLACRGGGCTPFPLAFSLKGDERSGAFVRNAFAFLWQAAYFTYAALAADPVYVIALVRAAARTTLSLLRRIAKRIKK